jgi:hypothetical protein
MAKTHRFLQTKQLGETVRDLWLAEKKKAQLTMYGLINILAIIVPTFIIGKT